MIKSATSPARSMIVRFAIFTRPLLEFAKGSMPGKVFLLKLRQRLARNRKNPCKAISLGLQSVAGYAKITCVTSRNDGIGRRDGLKIRWG